MKRFITSSFVLSILLLVPMHLRAAETLIGTAFEHAHMEVGAVYLQAVTMQPTVKQSFSGYPDIHLELDIHATEENPNGFAVGEWIPYLGTSYHLSKVAPPSKWEQTGELMPMVASDGPHYGANIKLDGAGRYTLTFHIVPPSWRGMFRHTDKETGVGEWFKPFDVSWTFNYMGTGKKGGY